MKRALLSVGVFVLAACSALFEDPVQCTSDADCVQFSAVCNVSQGVCAKSTDEVPGRDGGSSTNPPATTRDAAVTSPQCTKKGSAVVPTEITAATTLDCDKEWALESLVFVRAGATLTIAAGTTIKAKKGVGAGIVVATGARIVAEGQKDLPIVFTSDAAAPVGGDWRGIYVLGKAPPEGGAPVEDDAALPWGGTNAADDNGVISFVRIEYARAGLTFAGAGNKTKVDFVQVRHSAENCFFFIGGNVNVKHLICQAPGDDQFEWWQGATGHAQFLFGQRTPAPPVFNADALLVDGSHPVIRNMTVCGARDAQVNGYGIHFRDGATIDVASSIVVGWFSGVDATGTNDNPGAITTTSFSANLTNPAFVEDTFEDPDLPTFDDDDGYDEIGELFANRGNSVEDPRLADCFDPLAPKPWPSGTISGPAAPADGFFDPAAYVGAFKDQTDNWMTGAWVRFDNK